MRQKDLVPQSYDTLGVIVNYYSEHNLEKKVLKLNFTGVNHFISGWYLSQNIFNIICHPVLHTTVHIYSKKSCNSNDTTVKVTYIFAITQPNCRVSMMLIGCCI